MAGTMEALGFGGTVVGFMCGGGLFFSRFMFADLEVKALPQAAFALVFGLSCAMLELLIFEIAGVFPRVRHRPAFDTSACSCNPRQ